jgi:putative tricarboxylic transport membrane protein
MIKSKWILTAAIIPALLLVATPGQAADPFYKGKTLNLIVGYAPGGGSDITCRLFAEHMPRFIPGNPTMVVRNMPGAGGSNALNFVGEAAKPDGLTALCGSTNPLLQILKDKALRVDLRKFQYVAGIPDSQVLYVRSDVKPGIKKPSDIFDAEGLILGGFRASSTKDLMARLAFDMFGLQYKYVAGINGDGKGRTHMQQGFINAWQEGMGSYISITIPTMVETGVVTPLFQSGQPDANGQLSVRNQALPDMPTLYEVYKEHFGKAPSGMKWDAYSTMVGVISVALRTMALPAGAPKEAVNDLRAALQPMLKDEKFMADARKALGDTIEFNTGEAAQKAFEVTLNAPEAINEFLIKYTEEGKAQTNAGK